jgi:hypothetical protein
MKKLTFFSLCIAFLILLLPFSPVFQANAGGPDRTEETIDFSFEVENPCGYPITGHVTGTVRTTFFWFYENGLKNRVQDTYASLKATWSANGKEINIQNGAPVHYSQIPNGYFQTVLGANGKMTIPGYGAVMGSAGQIILTWQWNEELGDYEMTEEVKNVGMLNPKDWDAVCEYLGE